MSVHVDMGRQHRPSINPCYKSDYRNVSSQPTKIFRKGSLVAGMNNS